ncbi:histidine phosphatase family protein [Gottfriedia solisilvae]|uniref:Alpha-ribazole-5'-phosphate phosphatase n=1 Tax=Gottfriedia solisilvae TaxID=1516104 RepID=A0A8J3EZU1_9BACI|nr:histidine phosphatase family protein [Gottfriedia solisilvae]GGI15637.1 alpha-ribazole-5'-phosphate phosphatase [Gottfriedia solisilvae]
MKILLVRHTESEGNMKKVYAGSTDYVLTVLGEQQIVEVMMKLLHIISPTSTYSLYSSPLQRCTKLAEEIERLLQTTKIIDSRLSETNFGIFEDKTYEELTRMYPDILESWIQDSIHFQIPNGESLKICFDRVSSFCKDLINRNEDAVIVSHGGIIKLIILALLDLDLKEFWKFYTSNGCVIEIIYNDGFGYIKNISQLEYGDEEFGD